MKQIIDIPRKVNERIRANYGHNRYPSDSDEDRHIVANAIYHGTPIPDNATVEDVINIVTNKALPIKADDCGIFMSIPTTWLKRPYQKGGKE